jgi:hypothetical protein
VNPPIKVVSELVDEDLLNDGMLKPLMFSFHRYNVLRRNEKMIWID